MCMNKIEKSGTLGLWFIIILFVVSIVNSFRFEQGEILDICLWMTGKEM